MAQLALAKSFLPEYARLESKVRKSVDAAIAKFAVHTHAGLHLEKIAKARDPRIRTIRIDDYWRGVVLSPAEGDVYCLMKVLGHDEAIRYAASRAFSVNQAIYVFEVRDQSSLEQMEPTLRELAEDTPERLFGQFSDKDLTRLGIDADVLPIVRLLVTEIHLQAIEKLLPEPQYIALIALASGATVDEAWSELAACLPVDAEPVPQDTEDLVTAMRRTPGEIVFVEGAEELQRILAHPFDAWRVFLHPTQSRIALRDTYAGPVQVSGGAGTGKTVTALHRARHLARRNPRGWVLLTTFTKHLSDSLRQQLELIVDEPSARERIEVGNIDAIAYRIVSEHRGRPGVAMADYLEPLWAEAARGTRHSPVFLAQEWEQVILAQGIGSAEEYLRCSRTGRSVPLSRVQRGVVWKAVSKVTDTLAASGRSTFRQLAGEAAELVRGRPVYDHIIVDEAQDLHPLQWRLIRALTSEGPDDLFLVGDPHQRIYDSHVSLGALGINVRGRSWKLKLNYRTTQEILEWAVPVLGLTPPAGLDDQPDTLHGYRSPRHGRRPKPVRYTDFDTELDGLISQVRRWLDDGVEPTAIGIAARRNHLVKRVAERLAAEGIPVGDDGIRAGTMHRMKGLEFRCVAVVGASEGTVPETSQVTPREEDPKAHSQDMQRERCLLFVACTRARDHLHISYSGEPSPFLN